ncbi:MAG: hypothetical protein ACP5FL_01615, partial [Thermoplasmatota archaeon]
GLASISALIFSLYAYIKTRSSVSYADLDYLYLELLKLGTQFPKLTNPNFTTDYKNKFDNEDELSRYNTFAFISWNICETIYDRCCDKQTWETWRPVIEAENRLHRKWFDEEENFHKFKKSFREFIVKEFPGGLLGG